MDEPNACRYRNDEQIRPYLNLTRRFEKRIPRECYVLNCLTFSDFQNVSPSQAKMYVIGRFPKVTVNTLILTHHDMTSFIIYL